MAVLKRFIVCIMVVLMVNLSFAGIAAAAPDLASARQTVTKHEPRAHAASVKDLPGGKKGWWSRHKWWVIAGVILVAGGAASAGGGGGGGGGGGTSDASVTVGW